MDLDEIDEFDAQIDEEFGSRKKATLGYQKHRLEAAKRIQALQRSDAYIKKSYSTLIRDLNEAQGERQRAMTALDLACSVLRHKKRDMAMFRRLSEELELTSSIDQFEIPCDFVT